MKDWSLGLILGQSLGRDLRKGWSLFGLANYSRLVGDFRRSPLVADRGSADQWFGAVGLGYSW
jgi:outer membrane scaffolding protein for murein synthesis (MipA/OmpV family)